MNPSVNRFKKFATIACCAVIICSVTSCSVEDNPVPDGIGMEIPGSQSPTTYKAEFYLAQHTVKAGETLSSICNRYNTNYYEYSVMILAMNNLKNASSIWGGKIIYIPCKMLPSNGYGVIAHTIQSGEDIFSICRCYGVSYSKMSSIIEGLNLSKNLDKFITGDTIYIPVSLAMLTVPSEN